MVCASGLGETTMNEFIRDATAKLVLALVLLAQLFQRHRLTVR
jgi:hypothetical protein